MSDKTKPENLPGIPKSSNGNLPKGTPPARPAAKSAAEKAARKAEKRRKREAQLAERAAAEKKAAEEAAAAVKIEGDAGFAQAQLAPINDPTISPDIPAADVPVLVPENDNAPTDTPDTQNPDTATPSADAQDGEPPKDSGVEAGEAPVDEPEATEGVVAEPPVPDATGVAVSEDDIKVDEALVAESEAADKAKPESNKQRKARLWRERQAAAAAKKADGETDAPRIKGMLKYDTEKGAFVADSAPKTVSEEIAAVVEIENKAEVEPAPVEEKPPLFKGDALAHFAEVITMIRNGVTAESLAAGAAEAAAEQDRPADTEAPTEEAPNNAPTPPVEEPKPEPAKPTIAVDNTKTVTPERAALSEEAKKFYGKCYNEDRASLLDDAVNWLNKAIKAEADGKSAMLVGKILEKALEKEAQAFCPPPMAKAA